MTDTNKVEPDGPVKVHMRCQDCGHEQTVRGNRLNGATYFGSGYDFCDKCDGVPRVIPNSVEPIAATKTWMENGVMVQQHIAPEDFYK